MFLYAIKTIILLVATANAADWNYLNNGADWLNIGNCNGINQSPIDLPTNISVDKYVYATKDDFNRMYTNQVRTGNEGILIKWDGFTSKTEINRTG
jgi:hypothetical protein